MPHDGGGFRTFEVGWCAYLSACVTVYIHAHIHVYVCIQSSFDCMYMNTHTCASSHTCEKIALSVTDTIPVHHFLPSFLSDSCRLCSCSAARQRVHRVLHFDVKHFFPPRVLQVPLLFNGIFCDDGNVLCLHRLGALTTRQCDRGSELFIPF